LRLFNPVRWGGLTGRGGVGWPCSPRARWPRPCCVGLPWNLP